MTQRTARALARLVGPTVFAVAVLAGTVLLDSALRTHTPADSQQLAAAPSV